MAKRMFFVVIIFRDYDMLKILNLDSDVSKMQIGDFIEVLLQKKGNAK